MFTIKIKDASTHDNDCGNDDDEYIYSESEEDVDIYSDSNIGSGMQDNMSIDDNVDVHMYNINRNDLVDIYKHVKKKKYIKWSHKKMNIELFRETLEVKCEDVPIFNTAKEAARWLLESFTDACNFSMPWVKKTRRRQAYWWNSMIAELRVKCKDARKKWQRQKRRCNVSQAQIEEAEIAYRAARILARNEINRSKARAWEELIQSINDDPWGLPYKVMLKRLRRSSPCISEILSLDVLNNTMDKLFPHDPQWNERIEEFPDTEYCWNEEEEITYMEIYRLMCKRNITNTASGHDGVKALYLKVAPGAMIAQIVDVLINV